MNYLDRVVLLFKQSRFVLAEQELRQALLTIGPSNKVQFAATGTYALRSNQGGTYDAILKHLKR